MDQAEPIAPHSTQRTPASSRWRHSEWAASTRLAASAAAAVVVGLVVATVTDVPLGVLAGIATLPAVFDLSAIVALSPMDGDTTRANSRREVFRPVVEEGIVVVIAIGSVAGIAVLQMLGDTASRNAAAAVGLLGVFTTWAMLHLMYSTRYANLYYDEGRHGSGIDFNNDDPPSYRDFQYFSFTLGMTYAVSDCNISTTAIRGVALRHGIISFVFGTVILAATINLVAGIVTG